MLIFVSPGYAPQLAPPSTSKVIFFKVPVKPVKITNAYIAYRKVASGSLSRLVAHSRISRLFMKGKFDGYVLVL